ncbi:hypothetical protein Tco_1149570 [Tanacetum coccineum]
MEFESAQSNTTAKLPILKVGGYEMWVIRIKQYFQVQDYALWEVIDHEHAFSSKLNRHNPWRIRKFSMAQDIGARAAIQIFSRINFTIAKGVGPDAIGYGFFPFSFSFLEELDADAVTLLKRIRKFFMAQDIGECAVIHIFNRISFSIAK